MIRGGSKLSLSILLKNINNLSKISTSFSTNIQFCKLTSQFSNRNKTTHYSTTSKSSNLSSPAENSLPSLPVPSLEDTLSKFVKSVKPLLNDIEFQSTLDAAKKFGSDDGGGRKLQSLLEERSSKTDNWLSDWWLSEAYLKYRSPVTIFSSPGLVFPSENFKSVEDQISYASKLAYGALLYKEAIYKSTITPDRMGKISLDMSQYTKVFGTNRNPGKTSDQLNFYPQSRHFIVAYKNYFYKVSACCESGQIVSPSEIYNNINYILKNENGLSGIPVGILTSENRDNWYSAYKHFRKNEKNKMSLKEIEEAVFLVSIDRTNRPLTRPTKLLFKEQVEDKNLSEKQTIAALQMLHGNRTNSGNRWFDKTIQFIVGSEGECGLNYEHSPAEGPPIANMMDFILSNFHQFQINKENDAFHEPKKLPFDIDQKMSESIARASDNLGVFIDDVDMSCFTFKKFGKSFIKSSSLSPDSFIQIAIQTAFHRVHGIAGAQYESGSTRMFKSGRTETIRSCSQESLEFAQALNKSSDEKLKGLTMKRAIEAHKNYAAQAVRGLGIDRHLLGLKLIAQENNIPLPEFFNDKGFKMSSHYRLSTSQVASSNLAFMCYAPLVTNGYGCCYNPRAEDISFGLSSFVSCKETSVDSFKSSLVDVLLDMQNIALKNIPSKL